MLKMGRVMWGVGATLIFLAGYASQERPGALFREALGSPVAVGSQPTDVALADVNGDGKLDAVVANAGSSDVSVLLGDGRGGFEAAPSSPFPAGPKPHLVALADLNHDGKLDLVTTEHDSNEVRVFLGRGGEFQAAPGSPFKALRSLFPHNHGLVVRDVNGDGHLDILTSNHRDGSVSVLVGDGQGGFRGTKGSPFGVGRGPYPLAVADVNGDGKLDIVTPDVGSDTVSVLLGDGGGGFRAAPGSPVRVDDRPYFVAAGRLDSGSNVDLVVMHDDSQLVTALLGDGRGGFRPAPGSPTHAGLAGGELALGDVNGDGRADVMIGAGPRNVVVLLGDGTGRLAPAPGSPYPVGRGPWSIAIGDVNGDGRLDIVTGNFEDNSISVLLAR